RPNHHPAIAAAGTPRARPAPAPSISQTITGNVRNSTGHALNGAMASDDSAPATSAMMARFHPQARMIERPALRSLSEAFTANRLHRRAAGSHCHWLGWDPTPASLRDGGFRAAPGVR